MVKEEIKTKIIDQKLMRMKVLHIKVKQRNKFITLNAFRNKSKRLKMNITHLMQAITKKTAKQIQNQKILIHIKAENNYLLSGDKWQNK